MTQKIKSTEQIEEFLDIFQEEKETGALVEAVQNEFLETTVDEDLEFSRKSIREMIPIVGDVVESLASIAASAEDSKSYEALATNFKVYTDMCMALTKMANAKKDSVAKLTKGSEKTGDTTNIQNNVVFSGSLADLLERAREADDAKVIENE